MSGAVAPHPFDVAAEVYDAGFTERPLGRWLRAAVWDRLTTAFQPGQCVLELGCGTGEDAVWLARRGVRVVATDAAEAMLEIARQKVESAGLAERVSFVQFDLARLRGPNPLAPFPTWEGGAVPPLPLGGCPSGRGRRPGEGSWGETTRASPAATRPLPNPLRVPSGRGEGMRRSSPLAGEAGAPTSRGAERSAYDGAFSNFGALNCLPDRRPLAGALAECVRSGGRVVLVVMGPFCPWEIVWHLVHGETRTAFRRFRSDVAGRVAPGAAVRVWYPSPRRLRAEFAPLFRHRATVGIGSLLPPSYLAHLVERWPSLFGALAWLDRRLGGIFPWTWLNDHYLIVFERIASPTADCETMEPAVVQGLVPCSGGRLDTS